MERAALKLSGDGPSRVSQSVRRRPSVKDCKKPNFPPTFQLLIGAITVESKLAARRQ